MSTYLDVTRWLCFSPSRSPSRVPPEPCMAAGPDRTFFPTPNCQRDSARNTPYESIRYIGLKLPSFGKKIDKGANFQHAPCDLESRRFPPQPWMQYGVALACTEGLGPR